MIRARQLTDGLMSIEPSTNRQATNRQAQAESATDSEEDNRRSESDRREEDRRRSAKGLFELRARRDRIVEDRRQLERRSTSRFRLAFWRRHDA